MALTLTNWIVIGIFFLVGVALSICTFVNDGTKEGIIVLVITVLLVIVLMFGISWYHNNTASGSRAMKDYQSNMNNGIERYLAVIADDGMVIYEREGHFDVEIHDNYIVFDEMGERTILYRSLTSTLLIEETGN